MGRYDLRLTESEFWRMTPRAFMALVKRFNIARRHDMYCGAIPAAAIYNVHRQEGADPISPLDLIGPETGNTDEPRRLTADEMAMLFQGVMAPMYGGEVTGS